MLLKDFIIQNHTFALQEEALGWEDAVKIGTDLLCQAGAASPEYYDAIIRTTDELGPYYVIAPGIAMPHARPELGAKKTGFALITLKKPVSFGHEDNDPVDVILCICAATAQDLNEQVIIEAVTLFDSEEAMDKLRTATRPETLYAILEEVEQLSEEE
ncbi:MAG: PTS sugar transporter subunit IIA [Treponema sp.]